MEKSTQGWTYDFPCIKPFITPNPRTLCKSLWSKKPFLWVFFKQIIFLWSLFQKANQNFSPCLWKSPSAELQLDKSIPLHHLLLLHFSSAPATTWLYQYSTEVLTQVIFVPFSYRFLSHLLNFVRHFQKHLIWKTEVHKGFDILGLFRVVFLWLFKLVLFGWVFVVFLGFFFCACFLWGIFGETFLVGFSC